MTRQQPQLDLVVLVPGKNEKETIEGLLSHRGQSLGLRPIKYKALVHPHKDPGCFGEAPEVLRSFLRQSRYALVIFDHEGSGQEGKPPEEIAAELKRRLAANGWEDRAEVLVIVPELEVWVWSDSRQVDIALGWEGRNPPLRKWLKDEKIWDEGEDKPTNPKQAVEKALKEVRLPRSSSIYGTLAKDTSLKRCKDPSFAKLKKILRVWFRDVASTT